MYVIQFVIGLISVEAPKLVWYITLRLHTTYNMALWLKILWRPYTKPDNITVLWNSFIACFAILVCNVIQHRISEAEIRASQSARSISKCEFAVSTRFNFDYKQEIPTQFVDRIFRPANKQTENMVQHFPERADFSLDCANKIGKIEFYHVATRVFMLQSVFV